MLMIRKILLLTTVIFFSIPASAQFMHRSEISVSYGVSPVTTWVDTYSNIFTRILVGGDTEVSGWGAVTIGYNFRIIGKLSIGAQVAYSSNKQTSKSVSDVIKNHYWTVMPNVKWNWLGLKIVNFYSRLGAGVTYAQSKAGGAKSCDTQLAFQVSPLGVEVGGRLSAYAEAGIGTSGCLIVGARYRF